MSTTPAENPKPVWQLPPEYKAKCGGDLVRERMVTALFHRVERRANLQPIEGDTKEEGARKLELLLKQIGQVWPKDPVLFIRDCIWVADAKGQFQANDILPNCSPKGAAPLILEEAQEKLVRELERMLASRMPLDLVIDKSRQVAATWIVLAVFLWAWLFRPSSRFILGTYDIDLVDGGGKGSRDSGSLFGRLRFMLDGLIWMFPYLRFNQHFDKARARQERGEGMTELGFLATEDVTFRLTRPAWKFPLGRDGFFDLHKDAVGNTIIGRMPTKKFARADNYTGVLLDEMGEYDFPLSDHEAFSAARACSHHIVCVGTVAKNGGVGTLFRELCTMPTSPQRTRVVLDWCHLSYYLTNGRWPCASCGHQNRLTGLRLPEDLRWRGEGKYVCKGCGQSVFVPLRSVTSDWFEAVKESVLNNPVTLAREYWHDWDAAFEDTVFPSFDEGKQVRREIVSGDDWRTIQGFDPGQSEANPAAWVMARYSPSRQRIHVVAWHQASGWSIYKWVPFFKCWSPQALSRMDVLHGDGASSWGEMGYDEYALFALGRASLYAPGDVYGDKYGAHDNAGVGSAYDAISRYGVDVKWRYAYGDAAPEAALLKLRDVWLPRLTVDPDVAVHRPRWRRGQYPSIVDSIRGARWISSSSHTAPKRDVSEKEPKFAKHVIDALRYMIRDLSSTVELSAMEGGEYAVMPDSGGEVHVWGEYA